MSMQSSTRRGNEKSEPCSCTSYTRRGPRTRTPQLVRLLLHLRSPRHVGRFHGSHRRRVHSSGQYLSRLPSPWPFACSWPWLCWSPPLWPSRRPWVQSPHPMAMLGPSPWPLHSGPPAPGQHTQRHASPWPSPYVWLVPSQPVQEHRRRHRPPRLPPDNGCQ